MYCNLDGSLIGQLAWWSIRGKWMKRNVVDGKYFFGRVLKAAATRE